MIMNLSECIKDITIETLQEYPVIERLQDDIDAVYKYQEAIYVMASNPDEADLNVLRGGTVMAFSIIKKIIAGKDPRSFDSTDWRDVFNDAVDYGVMADPEKYTESIFTCFASYIDFSVNINKKCVKGEAAKEIKGIANEIRDMTDMLESGELSEADYVDRCLWSSFEAMIKLLASYKTSGLCPEYAKFIQAVADFSVQYGRLALYNWELDLLNGYLEGQKLLDVELEEKYNDYLAELQDRTDMFNDLMDNAFSSDFDQRLRGSVELARASGVSEDKILDTNEKIDAFFMD